MPERTHHSAPFGARWLFSTTAELTIRGGGKPYSNMALDADRKNGPAARSFAADAHDCIMVRIKRPYRIQVCGTKMCPMASSPRILKRQTDTVQTLKICKKSLSQVIIAPRAQASRRCQTQAPLGGKPPSFATVSLPDAFRALREPDRRRRDEERLSRSEQRTGENQKRPLDRKSPIQVRIPVSSSDESATNPDADNGAHDAR